MIDFRLQKRQKIIISSFLVGLGLLSGLFYTRLLIDVSLRFKFILSLGLLSYLLSFWSLTPGLNEPNQPVGRLGFSLNKTKVMMLLILPTFFTFAVASFYYILPIRWFTKILAAAFFGLSFYLLLLAQNVFNVAAIRTIPLYRVASTAAFIFTIFSGLCLYSVVQALNLIFYWNGVLIFLVSFPLILQILWSTKMEERISPQILAQSFILSLILSELSVALSFWPSSANIRSFAMASVLTSAMYILVGITTHHLRERLGRAEVWEYLIFGSVVWIIAGLITF